MLVKKVVVELMEHITSKPKVVVLKYLKSQVKALNKKLEENITEASMINEFTEGRGRNCMHFAAATGDIEMFDALVYLEGDILRVDAEGNTVLMIAIQHNHLHLVRHILGMPQLITLAELPRKGNVYPIHLAATGGKTEIMQALLDRKTILDRKSDDLGGVLQWAVMH